MSPDSRSDEEQARQNLTASYDGRRQHDWTFSAARANAHATLALIHEQRTTNEILVLMLGAMVDGPKTVTRTDFDGLKARMEPTDGATP